MKPLSIGIGFHFNLMQTNKEILEEKFHETLHIDDASNPKEIGAVVVFNCIYKHIANQKCSCNDLDNPKSLVKTCQL